MKTKLLLILIVIFISCEKNYLQPFQVLNLPTVITLPVDSNFTTSTEAQVTGDVTDDGNDSVIRRGIVYSTYSNPEISDSKKSVDTSGQRIFTNILSGLSPSTTYHARAFATNSKGTSYGNEVTFTTLEPGFILSKNRTIDTLLFKDTVMAYESSLSQYRRGIYNNLNLPDGVILYIRFDSVNGSVAGNLEGNWYDHLVHSGDTIHFNSSGYAEFEAVSLCSTSVDPNLYYPCDSKCYYSVRLSGKAETNETQYDCHYSVEQVSTNTFNVITFNSDTTFKCSYE